MKLEPKHIAPYFPYGLKVLHTTFVSFEKHIERVDIIESMSDCLSFKTCMDWYFNDEENDCEIKLLLRPLSDLTKEIEVNGDFFIPIKMLSYYANEQTEKGTTGLEWEIVSSFPYTDIEKLLEWHFDIFNLIPNNLAIDINSIK